MVEDLSVARRERLRLAASEDLMTGTLARIIAAYRGVPGFSALNENTEL